MKRCMAIKPWLQEFTTLILLGICLSGCSVSQNRDVGTAVGAVSGGLIGSVFGQGTGNVLGIGAGMVTGMLFGSVIGNNIDTSDKIRIDNAIYYNQTYQTTSWTNSYTKKRYSVTPTSDIIDVNDIPACRRYHITVQDSRCQVRHYDGIACLNMDGTWRKI